MRWVSLTIATVLAALLLPAVSQARASDYTERVNFKPGTTSATIKGAVTGYDTSNYLLGARAGQAISVLFSPNNNACYFNFIEPGANSAVHRGEISGNEYSANLGKSGDYRAEIYLMRNEARRGKTCRYSITIEISGQGAAKPGSDNSSDAKVPGTDFNATGVLPCARYAGQPMTQCKWGVSRDGDGSGQITIFWPDGGNRVIFFEQDSPASYDQSQADGDARMSVDEKAGLFTITIGDQRFELPDVIMTGG